MNRLPLVVLPSDNALSGSRIDQAHSATTPITDSCELSVFAPLHYEPKYSYPLIVWLHGEGQCENQLRYVMPRISMRNYAAVAPRGTIEETPDDGVDRFSWSQSPQHVQAATERILSVIDQASHRLNIHSDRIFLAGSGRGGTMAFRVAMSMPERFGGVLSLGGSFPNGDAPLGRLNDVRRLPLFIAVGRENGSYPESAVCTDLRLFHAAGMAVTVRQYPGKDELNDLMLADIDRWVMDAIATGQQAPVISS
jgi:phospholipase/carboxylesterase